MHGNLHFLFGFQKPLLRFALVLHSHKPRKNTFVLVGTTVLETPDKSNK